MSGGPRATRVLCEVGGTSIRFAWQDGPGTACQGQRVRAVTDFPDFAAALQWYLDHLGRAAPPQLGLAVAAPVDPDQDEIAMTNLAWRWSRAALRARFGLDRLIILNDFTALALALPDLAPHELAALGTGRARPGAAVAVLGPGTGLGVSGLVPTAAPGLPPTLDAAVALAGEGGHVTLAAGDAREFRVLDWLARRHGHASAERALSGAGLLDLHAARLELGECGGALPATPAELVEGALGTHDAALLGTLDLFSGLLGSCAGDLVLTLGAWGGVYLGGGIVPRLMPWFAQSSFRARFEAKGRYRQRLAAVPAWVIMSAAAPALRGLARCLDARDARDTRDTRDTQDSARAGATADRAGPASCAGCCD